MSGYMDPSLPLQKLTEVTKHLRSRNVSLVSLLPFAHEILGPQKLGEEMNIFFPRKKEWLLEWIVQRLREDDNDGAREARCDPEIWKFILHLLPSSTSASLVLKKHNILQVISKTFSEAKLLYATAAIMNLNGDTEEEIYSTPQEIVSSPIFNSTERGLPPVWKILSKLQKLLEGVSAVLLYIRQNWAAGNREGNVVTVLRGTPETGAQILGSYLEVCHVLVQGGLELEESWTGAAVNIWRSCVWGSPNLKKVSLLFSTFCLAPAARLISMPCTPSHLRREIERLIAEFIFFQEVVSGSGVKLTKSSRDLKPLMEPLKAQREDLPHIFRIGIISRTKKKKSDTDIVEAIFNSIISGVLGIESPTDNMVDSDAEIVLKILEVLVDTSTNLPSETLARHVDCISNLSPRERGSVRWGVVRVALILDFDIFLGKGNDSRKSRLIDALTRAGWDDGIVSKVLELLIDSFVKARDLEGFVRLWMQELCKEEARGGIWESDRVAALFADRMEKALLAGQIDGILRAACRGESWVVVDAVLRGVRREDTEDKLQSSLLKIAESVSGGDVEWKGWRALARALQIGKGLTGGAQQKALETMKKHAVGTTKDQAKQALFASEALMSCSDIEIQTKVLRIAIQAMKNTQRGWSGSVDDVDERSLGVAMVAGFAGRWLEVVERVSSDIRAGFVDEFLNMAMREMAEGGNKRTRGRSLWLGMLSREVFYEYPALKDVVLAALIAKLEIFLDFSGDVTTPLENIRAGRDVLVTQGHVGEYGFLLKSIAKYPLEGIKRPTRERILDMMIVLDASLGVGQAQENLRNEVKGVVSRLWSLGNARSFLARDARGFMNWVLNGGGEAGRKVLRYVLETKEQKRSREFLTNLIVLAEEVFLHAGQMRTEVLNVCEIIVEEFWKPGEEAAVKRLRNGILQKTRESIEAKEISGQLVGVWRRMWMLDRGPSNEDALGLAQRVIENIKTTLPTILTPKQHLGKAVGVEEATKVAVEVAMLLCVCSRSEEEVINTTALVVGMFGSHLASPLESQIMTAYKNMILDNMDPNIYLECLETVVNGCFALGSGKLTHSGYWEVFEILIGCAKKPEDDELSRDMTDCLSTVFSRLARNLPKVETVDEFMTISNCMETILREKSWAVMQYNIDETLASVAITASPSGPRFGPSTIAAGEVITQLCNLSRAILTLYRRRVRGSRYHLVVAVLKSILHCIYKRKLPGERKKTDRIIHPPWLLATAPVCGDKLDTRIVEMPRITGKCIDDFNRLLTTFCQPTASSVRERARRGDSESLVNSVRDREKREVASSIGSLLGEILKGELEGGFEGDITEGTSAIFEVLGPEGVKAFAKTVDREGRAMLRELWDEYNRVGGGASEKF